MIMLRIPNFLDREVNKKGNVIYAFSGSSTIMSVSELVTPFTCFMRDLIMSFSLSNDVALILIKRS